MKSHDFNFELSEDKKQVTFTINSQIYSLNSIYQTAYFFLDKVYVLLDGDPQKQITVTMKIKEAGDLEKLAGEFHNELLNQLLREKVSTTNAKIREYIVSQALYNAVPNEVDELLKEVEEEDWQEDPLGITKPWEEQNQPKAKKKSVKTAKAKKKK